MRQQVIEIFENWIADWSESGNRLELHEWLNSHYPDTASEVEAAVDDCFKNNSDAFASWEVDNNNEINVIIHPIVKHQNS